MRSLFASPRFYDAMYRFGAPWEGAARGELVDLVTAGRLRPCRAIDLGCGSGANAIFLADHGFSVVGVDFSPVALHKAERNAGARAGVRFVHADLTAASLGGAEERYELLVDYGTLDDLAGEARDAMTRTIHRVAAPGAHFLLWCFFADRRELPAFSLTGPSRLTPVIEPGEVERRFGAAFEIERLAEPPPGGHAACFLLRRR